MAIVSPDKIFIDVAEEITFIIEKVLNAERDQVIIVVPQNSLLLSSGISINILYRSIANSKKIAVIVTEDAYGERIAAQAGFVVVPKVSNVTSELWNQAYLNKENTLKQISKRKNELLEDVLDKPVYSEPDEPVLEKDDVLEETPTSEQVGQEAVQAEIPYEEQELEQALEKYKKPKREPKITEIDGITIYAGGNIKNLNESSEHDIIDHDIDTENDMENTRNIEPITKTNFAGRDFTKFVKPRNSFSDTFRNLFFLKRKTDIDDINNPDKLRQQKNYTRNLGIIAIVIVLFLSIGTGVLAFKVSTVEVITELKKEEKIFSDKIIADTTITEANFDEVTIPALLRKEEGLNISRTGSATGKGNKGEKAKGFVTIYNTTATTVTIASGTKITNVGTSKQYILKQNVSLPAVTSSGGGPTNISSADDVPVEAIEIGDSYNLDTTDTNTLFTIEGYSGVEDVYARRYRTFEGGTSQEFTSVSEQNVNELKEKVVDELKLQAQNKIKAFVPQGYKLIEESIKFNETKASSFPAIGAETTDGTFSLTVEGNVTAVAVKEADLESIITQLLSTNNTSNIAIDSMEDIKITEVVISDNKVSFTVSSLNKIVSKIDEDAIKEEIKGMTISDAEDYITSLEEVENARIEYTPSFLPEFVKQIPNDTSRIEFKNK